MTDRSQIIQSPPVMQGHPIKGPAADTIMSGWEDHQRRRAEAARRLGKPVWTITNLDIIGYP